MTSGRPFTDANQTYDRALLVVICMGRFALHLLYRGMADHYLGEDNYHLNTGQPDLHLVRARRRKFFIVS